MNCSARIVSFVVSPGHDFKGHHGGPRGNHPVAEPQAIACVAGLGIEGDRYFDRGEGALGQITFFDWSVLAAVREHFGLPDLSPTAFRRNVLIEGADLPALVGRRFALQGIQFEGTQDCAPCYWMDQAVAPGAHSFLEGRGGLRARILTSGTLRVGDAGMEVLGD